MNTEQLLQQHKEHTRTISKLGLHVISIGNNMADVFSGDGFSTPTRLRKAKGQWLQVGGPKLSAGEAVAVVTALS